MKGRRRCGTFRGSIPVDSDDAGLILAHSEFNMLTVSALIDSDWHTDHFWFACRDAIDSEIIDRVQRQ